MRSIKTILVMIFGSAILLLAGGYVIAGPATSDTPYTGGCAAGYSGCGGGGCDASAPDLSDAEIEIINREKEAFYNATKELRESMYEKKRALIGELSKKNPDTEKAGALQNELNTLKGEFDQRYLQFVITMKKLAPGYGPGSGGGGGGSSLPPCCGTGQ
jgi:Spy/CpxP family protein refolding chaperone